MKRKELAKKLSLIMLGGMLTLPCITPAVCMADHRRQKPKKKIRRLEYRKQKRMSSPQR